ncbi:MAG: hypothetical protein QOI86_4196 [Actinomycetota bacterium]|nr:hypothetical protein [Actinomycetota bacterium]
MTVTTSSRIPRLPFAATLPALVRWATHDFGERDFIVTDTERMTFAETDAYSRRLAAELLADGIGKGTRVALHFPYGPDWVVAFLAVTRIGALAMPVSTAYKPPELAKVLRIGDVHTLLAPRRMFGRDEAALLEEAVPGISDRPPLRLASHPYLRSIRLLDSARSPHGAVVSDELLDAVESEVTPADLGVVIFTSGTTSAPKGVMHTHGALVRHTAQLAAMLGVTGADRIYCGMPFFWIGGLGYTLLPALHAGATILCLERFEAGAALELMERERATRITGWSNVIRAVLTHPSRRQRDLSSIPILSGESVGNAHDPRANVLGMTETIGPHMLFDARQPLPDLTDDLFGSNGYPVPYVEHRVVDPVTAEPVSDGTEGELCLRGYNLMAGLYKREREEVFDADGWYRTGDHGTFRSGLFFFTGRRDTLIKTAGNNVAPLEVELAMLALPEVKETFVLGVPDPEREQVVAAVVVPVPGALVEPNELRDRLHKQLSAYKVPRHILVLDAESVPRLGMGKPDLLALQTLLAANWPATNGTTPETE